MKKVYALLIGLCIALTGFSQSCLPEGIEFSTQAQIDNFQFNYPNCTEIEGGIYIMGNDITNLYGLSMVNSIGGSLAIQVNVLLASLIGLEGLTNIEGELIIGSNISLTDLTGLDNVTSIGGYVDINYNDNLTSLTGLDNVTIIGGYLHIEHNDSLTSLTGLDNVTSVGGDLKIEYNNSLISLTGLGNLTSILGTLIINSNNFLTNLSGLDNIDAGSITDLTITNNNSLSTCEVQSICNYLASPNGIVEIYYNETGCTNPPEIASGCNITLPCLPYGKYYFHTQNEIDSFQTDYPNCTGLEGRVRILYSNITNLNGLNIVTSIGGDLFIEHNNSLTTLSGFNNLTTIGTYLLIENNPILMSLTGLDNINAGSISNLYIVGNESLSTCAVKSICDYIASPNGNVSIYSNATGCDSSEEVDSACVYLSNGETYSQPTFSINPNPASTTITISLPFNTPVNNTTLSIYNVNAQQVISRRITEPITVLDIGTLPRGVYFVRITTAATVMVNKFIKQ